MMSDVVLTDEWLAEQVAVAALPRFKGNRASQQVAAMCSELRRLRDVERLAKDFIEAHDKMNATRHDKKLREELLVQAAIKRKDLRFALRSALEARDGEKS